MRGGTVQHLTIAVFTGVIAVFAGCSDLTSNVRSPFGSGSSDEKPIAAQPQPQPTDTAATNPGPTIDQINAGLTDTAEPETARFVGTPVANDGDRPARFVSSMNIYGEMPGSPKAMPDGQLANLRQVSFTHDGADFDACVSPDGKFMVFASTQHRPTADIYLKKVDGQTVTQLTSDSANDTMPAISPDGKTLAFCSNRSGSWDIYLKPIAGGQPVQLTRSASHELHPSWSPDGRQIVYTALGEQSGQWEMVLISVDKPAKRQFIGYGLFPEFSPTGNKIVFQRARARGTRWFGIWTMDIVNGEATRPTQIAASTNSAVITPTWSPDGKRLAFATVVNPAANDPNRRPRQADLWVINVDGSGRIKLTSDRFVNLQPTWGADGWVYFVTNRGGTDNIWAVRPNGASTRIADGPGKTPGDAAVSVPIKEE